MCIELYLDSIEICASRQPPRIPWQTHINAQKKHNSLATGKQHPGNHPAETGLAIKNLKGEKMVKH